MRVGKAGLGDGRPYPDPRPRQAAIPVRRLRRRFLLLVATALIVATNAVSAQAAPGDAVPPTTALARCQQNTNPDQRATLQLAGGRGTTFPSDGQQLRPGDVVRITPRSTDEVSTTGWWWQPAEGWNWVTPGGVQPRQAAPAGYPAPGLNQNSLVGRFNAFSSFEVMQNQRCLQVGTFGTFDLRINDPQDWDNFGAWNIDVKVYRNQVLDGGFEGQRGQSISSPWLTEGASSKVIATAPSGSHSGSRFAIISNGGQGWNALVQPIPVRPNTEYEVIGFFKFHPNSRVNTAFFGVRLPGVWPPKESHFGSDSSGLYQRINVRFKSADNTSVTLFAGFWGVNSPEFMQIDDIIVLSA